MLQLLTPQHHQTVKEIWIQAQIWSLTRTAGPEIGDQEHRSGRQKPSAQLEPFQPPTVIAKFCSNAFQKTLVEILRTFTEIMQCPLRHNLKQ